MTILEGHLGDECFKLVYKRGPSSKCQACPARDGLASSGLGGALPKGAGLGSLAGVGPRG